MVSGADGAAAVEAHYLQALLYAPATRTKALHMLLDTIRYLQSRGSSSPR